MFDLVHGYRSFQRLRTVTQTLRRHGFGHLVGRLRLSGRPGLFARIRAAAADRSLFDGDETTAARARQAMEDLGPTFVKLGQVLASRPDLIPEAFAREFDRLRDQVIPFPSEEARRTVEEELGGPLERFYSRFADQPLAAGSIGQVHAAELADGTPVVVKIKRPRVDSLVRTDLYILSYMARMAERSPGEFGPISPTVLFEEFQSTIRAETDFLAEASATASFHQLFSGRPGVRSPAVHWEFSTPSVLTLERLEGVRIDDAEGLARLGVDRADLARRLALAFMHQYLELGTFHADPHPGNLLVGFDGALMLVDFGQVGTLTPDLRRRLGSLVATLARGDHEALVDLFGELGVFTCRTDPERLRGELAGFLARHFTATLSGPQALAAFGELMAIGRRHALRFPRDLVLLAKSLVTVVSLTGRIDPELKPAEATRAFLGELLSSGVSPLRLAGDLWADASSYWSLLEAFPSHARDILRQVRQGRLHFNVSPRGIETFAREMDRSVQRLAVGVLAGAATIAAALLSASSLAGAGAALFALSGAAALWLLFGGRREREAL